MGKTIYKRTELNNLKELRYQKARVAIEAAYVKQRVDNGIRYYTEGGWLRSFTLGMGTFSSLGAIRDYSSYAIKGWKTVKEYLQKRKEKRAAKKAAAEATAEND